jgi:hypothetical protein
VDLIDWLVDADFRQWQGVIEHLAERRRRYSERIVGDSSVSAIQSAHPAEGRAAGTALSLPAGERVGE